MCYRLGKFWVFHFIWILKTKNRIFREKTKQMQHPYVPLFVKELLMILAGVSVCQCFTFE